MLKQRSGLQFPLHLIVGYFQVYTFSGWIRSMFFLSRVLSSDFSLLILNIQFMKRCSKFSKIFLVAMVIEQHRTTMVETTFEKVSDIFYSVNIHLYNLFYLPVSEKLGEIIPTFCGNFPGCICIYASVCNTQGALPW